MAEGRQPVAAAADVYAAVAAVGPDLTGSESAARGAPLGRTGCWARPGRPVAASAVAVAASAVASGASGASVVVVEVAEQEPPRPEGARLRFCENVKVQIRICLNRCLLCCAHFCHL